MASRYVHDKNVRVAASRLVRQVPGYNQVGSDLEARGSRGERGSIPVGARICWVSGTLTARDTTEEPKMGEIKDKTRNAAQDAKGKAKEAAGKATGNRKLESKGKTDQTKAKVKKTGEKVKDVFR
jgi:uncharacterized protein YjbJ (UPF0337 family)